MNGGREAHPFNLFTPSVANDNPDPVSNRIGVVKNA